MEKLRKDSHTFLLPSKPAYIAFVLDETLITENLIDEIVHILCNERKQFMRVCFIGTDRKSKRLIRHALSDRAVFSAAYINNTEKAKEWLISA